MAWLSLWLVLIPVVTVPLTVTVLSPYNQCVALRITSGSPADYLCPLDVVLRSYAPGLLNLVPLLALFSADPQSRRAGFLLGLLGAVRILVPLAIVLREHIHANGVTLHPYTYNTLHAYLASCGLWLVTLCIVLWLPTRTERTVQEPGAEP